MADKSDKSNKPDEEFRPIWTGKYCPDCGCKMYATLLGYICGCKKPG